jgi:hypothetical protein
MHDRHQSRIPQGLTMSTTIGIVRRLGQGEFQYEHVPDWGRVPAELKLREAVGVATDSQDRVYVFHRGEQAVIVLDPEGNVLNAWGAGLFRRPHGIHIGPDDALYLSDDQDHTVRKFTPEGNLLLTLGTSGRPSPTGIDGMDYRTLRAGAGPFNLPTNVALNAAGELYVSDGYGNCRVHHFSPDGRLIRSWGEPGSGPGQFNLPHGIGVDRHGRVYVADRENSRVQIFSADGRFLSQWTDLRRPCEVFFDQQDRAFVAEIGRAVGPFPWHTPDPNAHARLSVLDLEGRLLARFGGERPAEPGDFLALHDLWIDRQGNLYTAEVIVSAGGASAIARPEKRSLQKFVRRRAG